MNDYDYQSGGESFSGDAYGGGNATDGSYGYVSGEYGYAPTGDAVTNIPAEPDVDGDGTDAGGATDGGGAPAGIVSPEVRTRRSLAVPIRIAATIATALFLYLFPYIVYTTGLRGRLLTTVMIAALILSIAAMGLNLVAGYSGMLSLGHAAFMAAGALVMVKLAGVIANPWIVAIFAMIWGGLMGLIVALFCAHLKGFYLSIVTFLTGSVVPFVTLLVMGVFGGQDGSSPVQRLSGLYPAKGEAAQPFPFLPAFTPAESSDKYFYMFVVTVVLLTLGFTALIVNSAQGRSWKAIRDSEIAARACGIWVYPTRLVAFTISAMVAGLAGVVYSQDPLISTIDRSNFSLDLSFKLVFFILFGGIGTLSGPLIGTIALGFLAQILFQTLGVDQQPGGVGLTFAILLIVIVVLAPNGVVGMGVDARNRLERARAKKGVPPRRPAAPVSADEDRVPKPRHRVERFGGAPILELRGASKIFGGLRAVDQISFEVKAGTIHSLIGPNGSGKTTTINTITGFYSADEGQVLFQGQDVTSDPSYKRAHRGMTRTFQNLQVFRNMTCLENVMVGRKPQLKGWENVLFGDKDVKARAFGLLEFVGLAHRAYDRAGSLAYAEQRRLEIARALAGEPDLLLLDEPAAGMNPAETHELTALIREINSFGITVLLIEHHMDLVMELSDKITVLDFGTKIAEGSPEEVRNNPRVIEAYLGADA